MRDWGRLLRVALLPSAVADIAAGVVLGAGVWPAGPGPFLLIAASLAVYHGALVLNDSFGRTHLDDFLSRHFEHVEFRWTTRLNLTLIDSLRPDVVIDERSSRFLINLRPETTAAQEQCIREGVPTGSPMPVERREP